MPEFAWRAAESSGKVIEGRSTAATPASVMAQLRSRGLTPLRIEDAVATGSAKTMTGTGPGFVVGQGRKARGPVTPPDVLAFTSELAIMLRAGLALDNALRVLIEMSHKPSVAELLQGVLDDVKGGVPLSRALARNQGLFGDFYINMIRSGEACFAGAGCGF